MRKKLWIVLPIALVLLYFMGPTPETPSYEYRIQESAWNNVADIQEHVATLHEESAFKPGCGPKLILNDSAKTPYSILYLHGFSASPEEGMPTLPKLAKHWNWNAYAPTLHEHGLRDSLPLDKFTAVGAWESAVEAARMALVLGDSIVLVCTSTGFPLAARLAVNEPKVAALIAYSPNLRPADPASVLLDKPWGELIARLVVGDVRDVGISDLYYEQHWNRAYSVKSLPEMQELVISASTPSTLQSVQVPTLFCAWYEDDEHCDDVVSVPHMREAFELLGTPNKEWASFPAGSHVIANGEYSLSHDEVLQVSLQFLSRHISFSIGD